VKALVKSHKSNPSQPIEFPTVLDFPEFRRFRHHFAARLSIVWDQTRGLAIKKSKICPWQLIL
jgi:hypothetical protein